MFGNRLENESQKQRAEWCQAKPMPDQRIEAKSVTYLPADQFTKDATDRINNFPGTKR
jgi:hypothetical protein